MNDTKRIEAKLDKIANSIDKLTKELAKHRVSKHTGDNIGDDELAEMFSQRYDLEVIHTLDGRQVAAAILKDERPIREEFKVNGRYKRGGLRLDNVSAELQKCHPAT